MKVEMCKENDERILTIYLSSFKALSISEAIKFENVDRVYRLYDGLGTRYYLFVGNNNYYIVEDLYGLASKIGHFRTNDGGIITELVSFFSDIVMMNHSVLRLDEMLAVKEQIALIETDEVSEKYRNVNSNIVYSQFDHRNVIRCSSFNSYCASFDGRDKISSACFKLPYLITFDQFVKVTNKIPKVLESYNLGEWDRNIFGYNLALLKALGLKRYLKEKDNYDSFTMYYDKFVLINNEPYLYNLLTSKSYSVESLSSLLASKGFKSEVPQDLIDMFNGEHEVYKMFNDVISQVNNMDCKDNLRLYLKR